MPTACAQRDQWRLEESPASHLPSPHLLSSRSRRRHRLVGAVQEVSCHEVRWSTPGELFEKSCVSNEPASQRDRCTHLELCPLGDS